MADPILSPLLQGQPAQIDPRLLGIDPAQQTPVAPATAVASAPQSKPGPVKGFLTALLGGAGDAMRAHVGLETSAEEQARLARQNIAQQQADTLEKYRAAQASGIESKANQFDTLNAPYTFDANDQTIPEFLRGRTMTTGAAQGLIKVLGQNQGKTDAAEIRADAPLALARFYQEMGGNPRDHQFKIVGDHYALLDRRTGNVVKDNVGKAPFIEQRMQALGISAAGLGLRQEATKGLLYGTDLQGNALPGAPQITNDDGTTTPVGSRNAANAVKQQGKAATFNDMQGSTAHTVQVLEDLYKAGGALNTPKMIAAAQEPHGVGGQILNSVVRGTLTPEENSALAAINQLTEQAGILRSMTGGTSSEAQAGRILATLPKPGDSPAIARQKLKEIQNVLGRLNPAVTPVQGGVNVGGRTKPQLAAPPANSNDPFAAFGGKRR